MKRRSGWVFGVGAGSADIVATIGGESASARISVGASREPVVAITVRLATSTIAIGESTSAVAELRDAKGDVLSGRSVSWTSSDPTIATVAMTGNVLGRAIGTASIIAVSEGVTGAADVAVTDAPPSSPGAVADPTLLPLANGQQPFAGAYGRALAAGQTYVDPNSGVTVLKLTSSGIPTAGSHYHGYSAGGPNISQPWVAGAKTFYTIFLATGHLVDLNYTDRTIGNWRTLPIDGETNVAFSLNPASPRIIYYVDDGNDKTLHRYNTATNSLANTGAWPWNVATAGASLTWIQTQLNDTWIVGFLRSNQKTVAFRQSDGFERVITTGSSGQVSDEPHLDKEFPIVYLSGDADEPVMQRIANLETGTYMIPPDPQGINSDAHTATLRGRAIAVTWPGNGIVETSYNGAVRMAVTPSPVDWSGDSHLAGQWVFNNPNDYFIIDQWLSNRNYPIRQGMIGFVSAANMDKRVLVAHDAVGTGYDSGGQPHPTLSPDGKLVMWTSNMNGSGGYQVFVAFVPVRYNSGRPESHLIPVAPFSTRHVGKKRRSPTSEPVRTQQPSSY